MKSIIAAIAIAASLVCTPASAGSREGAWPGNEEPGTIVIVTSDHTLHYIDAPGHRISYPIAVGREGMQWFGDTRVTGKKANPDWRPTPDMRAADPKLPAVVKGGKGNPLGVMAIYLAQGYLRIHGTNNPRSIGSDASHGCFRMLNEDVLKLGALVKAGDPVIIIP